MSDKTDRRAERGAAQRQQARFHRELPTSTRYGWSPSMMRKDRLRAKPSIPFVKRPGSPSVSYDWELLDALHETLWAHGPQTVSGCRRDPSAGARRAARTKNRRRKRGLCDSASR